MGIGRKFMYAAWIVRRVMCVVRRVCKSLVVLLLLLLAIAVLPKRELS